MEDLKALFRTVRGRDRASFDALSEAYGWKLYSHIRKNTEDREEADRIFSETFDSFYDAVEDYEGNDPIEALLFSCADRLLPESRPGDGSRKNADTMGRWAIGQEAGFTLPPVPPDTLESPKKESAWVTVFYVFCIILLVIGIAAAVWVMLWMLMSMNLIPEMDLGYSWFNQHILEIF